MRPRLHRVLAPVAIVAAAAALLPPGLVLLAVCRRWPRERPAVQAEGLDARQAVLRVCADPNNLPFTNARGKGAENALAEMRDRGQAVANAGHTGRRGSEGETRGAGRCDVIMGVPTIASPERRLSLSSLEDPRLRVQRVRLDATGSGSGP